MGFAGVVGVCGWDQIEEGEEMNDFQKLVLRALAAILWRVIWQNSSSMLNSSFAEHEGLVEELRDGANGGWMG